MNFKEHIDSDNNLTLIRNQILDLEIKSYLVGGYVRDLLINRECKDIDIMTIGEPYELVKKIAVQKGFSDFKIFKNFGTASLNFKKFNYEFVGARKESYKKNSRNPDVSPGLFDDDMKRRDFTINALSVSMNKDYGELLDPFNGIEDLKNKLIRTCAEPNKTFDDDPLRMMRAIRFASQLNFDIEESTFKSICDNAQRIEIISQERITDELNKIILSDKPSYGFKLLFASGILKYIFPELNNLQGVETVSYTHLTLPTILLV